MVTYGKYEVPFVLEDYGDHLMRSNRWKLYVLSCMEITRPFIELYSQGAMIFQW